MPNLTGSISDTTAVSITVTQLVRSDTGLTPTGTTLPITSAVTSGAFSVPFVDVAPYPTIWFFTFTITWPDGSTSGPIGDQFTNPASSASGLFATLDMVREIYSRANVDLWSKDPVTGLADTALLQGIFNRSSAWMRTQFATNFFAVPSPTDALATQLGYIEAEIAGAYLYQANGLQDAAKGMDGKMTDHRESAECQLEEMFWLNSAGFTRVAGYSDAPRSFAATVDSNGAPIATSAPYPLWRWDGYQWVIGSV